MDCPICKDLERAFETRRSNYIAARSAAYYSVSTELAAYKNVEMERAKSDFEEHQLVCVSAPSGTKDRQPAAQDLSVPLPQTSSLLPALVTDGEDGLGHNSAYGPGGEGSSQSRRAR